MSKPNYRQMWMFPRNIRYIDPWKLNQIANILLACDADTSSQSVQDGLYEALSKQGVKIPRAENGSSNPGGMRTYFAQLACLGFFWNDKKEKRWQTTIAGDELISANNPLKVLRCQLLRMQYPSVYGNSPMVAVSPNLKIKPFCFLLKLLQDKRLKCRLSSDDIGVAVIYGRTEEDYEKVVNKILKLRSSKDFQSIIDSVEDIMTPRRHDGKDVMEKGVADARTIGNTAKNYLAAAQFITQCSEEKKQYELVNDQDMLSEIKDWREEPLEEAPTKGFEVAWQRRFGRFSKTKDTRRQAKTIRTDGRTALLRSRFISEVQTNPYSFDANQFYANEAQRWGFPIADVVEAVAPMTSRLHTVERDTVMDAAFSGGTKALILEKAITAIFKRLGFNLSEHIGQKRANREGGYPDIRIFATGMKTCGFGDTKATNRYEFPVTDRNKLSLYYRTCGDDFDDKIPSSWFLYIAGGFGPSTKAIKQNLQRCSEKYKHPVSAITVGALLDLAEKDSPPSPEELSKVFEKGGYFVTANLKTS